MYTKATFPTILLAGQAFNALALPATTVTLHSVITRTTIVPATTEAAGSNPSNMLRFLVSAMLHLLVRPSSPSL
jgi:hypothetical protein